MEDILILVLIAIAASLSKVFKNAKNKSAIHMHEATRAMRASVNGQERANEGQLRLEELQREMERHEKEQTVQKPAAQTIQMGFEGAHRHEGKSEALCPAIEREMPRKKAEPVKAPDVPTIPGLNLSFDRNTVVQGFVMSEILNRPRADMRR